MKKPFNVCMLAGLAAVALSCAPKEPAKYLALAFDDGPNMTTESKMLDVLEKHKGWRKRDRLC